MVRFLQMLYSLIYLRGSIGEEVPIEKSVSNKL